MVEAAGSRSRRRPRRAAGRGAAAAVALAVALAACRPGGDGEGLELQAERLLMGTTFRVRVRAEDPGAGRAAIEAAFAEVARLDALLSEWIDASEISAVNRAAGSAPVVVGPDLLAVVERSLRLSSVTGGAFDITFAACGSLWSFREARVPAGGDIEACLGSVGFEKLRLDAAASTVFLPLPGMRIGIGAIGKGYGVDRAAEALEARGVTDYIVDGGGDIRLRADRRGEPWKVGIAHPRRPGKLYGTIVLARGAVVTSGDYLQFFERDGVRYHHILDPRTGRPAARTAAVTVIAPNATDADALATGLFVMGPEAGLALIETLPEVEALFLAPDLAVHRSAEFPAVEAAP